MVDFTPVHDLDVSCMIIRCRSHLSITHIATVSNNGNNESTITFTKVLE